MADHLDRPTTMSRRVIESLRPWVCQDCKTRIAARALRLGTTTRAASTKAKKKEEAAKPKVHYDFIHSLDNAETVERRIANLGGRDQVKQLFPRLNQQGKPIVVAAAELQGLYKKYGHNQKLARQDEEGRLSLYGKRTSSCNEQVYQSTDGVRQSVKQTNFRWKVGIPGASYE